MALGVRGAHQKFVCTVAVSCVDVDLTVIERHISAEPDTGSDLSPGSTAAD